MKNIHTTLVTDTATGLLRPLRFVTNPDLVPSEIPTFPENPLDTDSLYEYYLSKRPADDHRIDADVKVFTFEDDRSPLYGTSMMELMNLFAQVNSALAHYTREAYQAKENNAQLTQEESAKAGHHVLTRMILETATRDIIASSIYNNNVMYSMLKMFYGYNANMVMNLERETSSPEAKIASKIAYTCILQAMDLFFLRMGFDHFRIIASQAHDIIKDCRFSENTLTVLTRNQGNYGFPATEL